MIANTTQQQAVINDSLGVAEIVFYRPGSITLADGVTVKVDRPCLVLLRKQGVSTRVAVSSPGGEVFDVRLTIATPQRESIANLNFAQRRYGWQKPGSGRRRHVVNRHGVTSMTNGWLASPTLSVVVEVIFSLPHFRVASSSLRTRAVNDSGDHHLGLSGGIWRTREHTGSRIDLEPLRSPR